jgi:hypothetical protein
MSLPVISTITVALPNGSSDSMSRRVSVAPAGYCLLARMPPPLVMAISAPVEARIASAIRLPIAVSCERTEAPRLSSSTAVVPIVTSSSFDSSAS